MTEKKDGTLTVRSDDLLCAICNQSDPDTECNPTVHPDWGWDVGTRRMSARLGT